MRRRAMLGGAVLAFAGQPAWVRPAWAMLDGFDPAGTPAIAVKNPSAVLLEAIVLAGKRYVAVGEHGVVIYSDDQGASWVQAEVPVNVTLTCVAFATPMLGWAAGHYGVILGTEDGGKSWRKLLDGDQADQLTLAAAQALQPGGSDAPGAPKALKRAEIFVSAGPNKPFLCMKVLGLQSVIVFGAYRLTMITEDGGRTWADASLRIYDRLSHNIYGACGAGDGIYLAAEMGLVFCSTDDGKTFLPKTPAGDATLLGILSAGNTLVTYGVAGSCARSTDGAQNWSEINLPTQDDVTAGVVLGNGDVLLATNVGALMLSKDNGQNFGVVQNIQPVPVYDMLVRPEGALMLAGSAGIFELDAAKFQV